VILGVCGHRPALFERTPQTRANRINKPALGGLAAPVEHVAQVLEHGRRHQEIAPHGGVLSTEIEHGRGRQPRVDHHLAQLGPVLEEREGARVGERRACALDGHPRHLSTAGERALAHHFDGPWIVALAPQKISARHELTARHELF
jgi:hypothetical protein